MSLAETETANVESINKAKPTSRFGLSGLKQFAACGLDLKIGDFRQLCEELQDRGLSLGGDPSVHEIANVLFQWMTDKLEQDAGK